MSDKAKILILSLNYAPEAIGIGPYSAGLAEHLASEGREVRVVAGWPYYPEWQVHDGYGRWWDSTEENGVQIIRCPHYVPEQPTGLKRLIHHASFAISSLPAMVEAAFGKPQIAIAVMPSMIAAPVAWLTARISGAKLWIHVQDFEVDAALATGLASEKSLASKFGASLERFLLNRADLVTTISPQMCFRLRDKGVPADRIAELRNWANHLDQIAGADGTAIREEWGLEGQFVALYSGNIANKQGLEVVIDAAHELAGDERIIFVICGDGANLSSLKERATDLANIQFHPLQPADRFAQLMRMADCHLLPQLAGAADLVLPSKLANMLASGRPIAATAATGTGIADEVNRCGIVVPPEDANALAKAIKSLADTPAHAAQLGAAGKVRAEQRWKRSAVLASVDSLTDRLVSAKADR